MRCYLHSHCPGRKKCWQQQHSDPHSLVCNSKAPEDSKKTWKFSPSLQKIYLAAKSDLTSHGADLFFSLCQNTMICYRNICVVIRKYCWGQPWESYLLLRTQTVAFVKRLKIWNSETNLTSFQRISLSICHGGILKSVYHISYRKRFCICLKILPFVI